jgi:hypothetical protein
MKAKKLLYGWQRNRSVWANIVGAGLIINSSWNSG